MMLRLGLIRRTGVVGGGFVESQLSHRTQTNGERRRLGEKLRLCSLCASARARRAVGLVVRVSSVVIERNARPQPCMELSADERRTNGGIRRPDE